MPSVEAEECNFKAGSLYYTWLDMNAQQIDWLWLDMNFKQQIPALWRNDGLEMIRHECTTQHMTKWTS